MPNPKTLVRNGIISLSSFSLTSDDGTSPTSKKKKIRSTKKNKVEYVKPKKISIHVRKSGLELFRNKKVVDDTLHTPPLHWKQAVSTPHHRLQEFDFPDDVSEIMASNVAGPNINKEPVALTDGNVLRRSKRKASEGAKILIKTQSPLKHVNILQEIVFKKSANGMKQIEFSSSDAENEVIDIYEGTKKTQFNSPGAEAVHAIDSKHESVKLGDDKVHSVSHRKPKVNISRQQTRHFVKRLESEVDIAPASQEIQFENPRPDKIIESPVEQLEIPMLAKKNTYTQSSQCLSENQSHKLGKSSRTIRKHKSLYRQPSQILLMRSKADKSKLDLMLQRIKDLEDHVATLSKTNKNITKPVQDISWQAQVNELLVDEKVEQELPKNSKATEVQQISMKTLMRDILGTDLQRSETEARSAAVDNILKDNAAKANSSDEVVSIAERLPLSPLRTNAVAVVPTKPQLQSRVDPHEVKTKDVQSIQLSSKRRISQRLIFDEDDNDEENTPLTNISRTPQRNSITSNVLPPPVNFADNSCFSKEASIINNNTPLNEAMSRFSRNKKKSMGKGLPPLRISKRLTKKPLVSGIVEALKSAMQEEINHIEENAVESGRIRGEKPLPNKMETIFDAVVLQEGEVQKQNSKLPTTLNAQNVSPQKLAFTTSASQLLDDLRQKVHNGALSQDELMTLKGLTKATALEQRKPQNMHNEGKPSSKINVDEIQVVAITNNDNVQVPESNEHRVTTLPVFPVVDDTEVKKPIPAPRMLRKAKPSPKSTLVVSRKSLKQLKVSKPNRESQLLKDASISKAANASPMESSDDGPFDTIEHFNRIEWQKIDEELRPPTNATIVKVPDVQIAIEINNKAANGVDGGKQARCLKRKSPEPPPDIDKHVPEKSTGKLARRTLENRAVENMAYDGIDQALEDSIEGTKTNSDNLAASNKKSLSNKLGNKEQPFKENTRNSMKNQIEVQDIIETPIFSACDSEEVNNNIAAFPIASCSSQVPPQFDNDIEVEYLNNNDKIEVKLHQSNEPNARDTQISKKAASNNLPASVPPTNVPPKTRGRKKALVCHSEEVNNHLAASPVALCSYQVQPQLDNNDIDVEYMNHNDNIQLELRQTKEQNVLDNPISDEAVSINSATTEPPKSRQTRGRKKKEKVQVPTCPVPSTSKKMQNFKPIHEEKMTKGGRKKKSESIQRTHNTLGINVNSASDVQFNCTKDALFLLNNKDYKLQIITAGNEAVSRYGRVQKVSNRKIQVIYGPSTTKKMISVGNTRTPSISIKNVKEKTDTNKKPKQRKTQRKNKERGTEDIPEVEQEKGAVDPNTIDHNVRTIHSEITEELPDVVTSQLKPRRGRRSRQKPAQPAVEPPIIGTNNIPLHIPPNVGEGLYKEGDVSKPTDELIPELENDLQVEITEPTYVLNREDIGIPTSDATDQIEKVPAKAFKAQRETRSKSSKSMPSKPKRGGRSRKIQPSAEEVVPPQSPLNIPLAQPEEPVANQASSHSHAGPSNVVDKQRIIFFTNNNCIKYMENSQSPIVYMGPGYKHLQVCSIRLQPKQKVGYRFPSPMVCVVLEGQGTLHYAGVDSKLVTNVTKFLVKEDTPFTVTNLGTGTLDIFGVQNTDKTLSNPITAAEVLKCIRH